MAATLAPLPMFGAYNEHWKNHPAGLPKSQYKPGTNPNTGASAVDTAYKAWQATQPATPATPTPVPQGTPWNGWTQDFTTPPPATTPTPTTTTPPATTPATGSFADKYTPAMMNQAYENPWYIINDVFQGVNQTSPLYQALRDMGADPLALFNVIKGSQDGAAPGGAKEFVNWLAETYQKQATPGQSQFGAQDLIGRLFSQDKFGADSKNTLGQILGAGDMSTQIRTLYNLARDASNISMNPLAARGYQSALAQAGDRYGEAMMATPGSQTEGPLNPAAWLKQYAPWLALGT